MRNSGATHQLTVIFTPETVSTASRARLANVFDIIIPVSPIFGVSTKNLAIIGRPDLHATLTKLQLWSLTQFSRILYLDADTLVLQNLDHLLDGLASSVTFAASPELGFPDCFNAGVMLLTPNQDMYRELCAFAGIHESFDGGDQGLLNVFFGDGTRGHPTQGLQSANGVVNGADDLNGRRTKTQQNGHYLSNTVNRRNWHRLSFTYNMEMHKVYRFYIPAVLRYAPEHKVLHFIGKEKPWHFPDGRVDVPEDASPYFRFYAEMVGRWWDVRRSVGVE